MYRIIKVNKFNVFELSKVAKILNTCGKDMARNSNLYHWDNPYIKTLLIVMICSLRNNIYLLYYNNKPIATFQTRIFDSLLHFEKLGTLPCEKGKGIGSLCIEKIEEIANECSCSKILLEVYEYSKHAILFYEHRGFKKSGIKNTKKYKQIIMEKSI